MRYTNPRTHSLTHSLIHFEYKPYTRRFCLANYGQTLCRHLQNRKYIAYRKRPLLEEDRTNVTGHMHWKFREVCTSIVSELYK